MENIAFEVIGLDRVAQLKEHPDGYSKEGEVVMGTSDKHVLVSDLFKAIKRSQPEVVDHKGAHYVVGRLAGDTRARDTFDVNKTFDEGELLTVEITLTRNVYESVQASSIVFYKIPVENGIKRVKLTFNYKVVDRSFTGNVTYPKEAPVKAIDVSIAALVR